MDIQQLIGFDQELLLKLNGSDSLFWDGFMWIATNIRTWIPMAIVLLYVIFKNNKIISYFINKISIVRNKNNCPFIAKE